MPEGFICVTCGAQLAPSDAPPEHCPVCEDSRQYVGWDGQRWTTLAELRGRLSADIREEEPGLTGIGARPSFAIGQRALLVRNDQGNVLWDCITLLDDAIVEAVTRMGGISAIAISHPHYYSAMVEWAHAFDARIYLHRADERWVMRPDPRITFWEGDTHRLHDGFELVRLGGHFEGGTVLHWAQGANGAGALLTGDIVQVVQDRRWVSFMRSYPNLVPLAADDVRRIVARLEAYPFHRLYGAWYGKVVAEDAKGAVQRSARRYIAALGGRYE
jgi:hypothetical protein